MAMRGATTPSSEFRIWTESQSLHGSPVHVLLYSSHLSFMPRLLYSCSNAVRFLFSFFLIIIIISISESNTNVSSTSWTGLLLVDSNSMYAVVVAGLLVLLWLYGYECRLGYNNNNFLYILVCTLIPFAVLWSRHSYTGHSFMYVMHNIWTANITNHFGLKKYRIAAHHQFPLCSSSTSNFMLHYYKLNDSSKNKKNYKWNGI